MHALVRRRVEQPTLGGIELSRQRNRDKIRPSAQRYEALVAQRVALEDLQHQFGRRPGAEDADDAGATALRQVDLGRPVALLGTLRPLLPLGARVGLGAAQ
jgi:hypothetical protein